MQQEVEYGTMPISEMEPEVRIKLTKEQIESATLLSPKQVRYLVDVYYQAQRHRIRAKQQVDAVTRDSAIVDLVLDDMKQNERIYKSALNAFAKASPVGKWSLSIKGIGPVIAAGLLAYIDIEKASNVGKLWRFAGLDPTLPAPIKGEKRKYNSKLKTLSWKIGESFVKVSGNPEATYGRVYLIRKAQEVARNATKAFAEQAEIGANRVGKTTEAYKHYSIGMLPPAHIHARAKRYAVKLFLSHWHYVAFECKYDVPPEMPYILTKPEHSEHFISPPNWPMVD